MMRIYQKIVWKSKGRIERGYSTLRASAALTR